MRLHQDVARWRLALFAFFFLPGVSMASWVTRTPAIRDRIGASIGEMGLVLFGLSVGAMTGILVSGALVSRFGTRPVTQAGLWLVVASMATISLGVVLGDMRLVACGLGFFGLGMGVSEIAINVDGAAVEGLTKKPVLHTLHGCFSLGTVCGALVGLGLTKLAFPVEWHLSIIAVLGAAVILAFQGAVPRGTARVAAAATATEAGAGPPPSSAWRDPRLGLIGLIVLGMALAEGAANDWLPILMVDEYGFSQVSGSLVFLAFAAAMTVGRFAGGYFLHRFGRAAVIRGSALLGATGVATVILAESPIHGGTAVILWGLGASLGFPVALSAAGDSGPDPAARVKVVAMGGYVAFLVGPPLLGFVGEHHGLRAALMIVFAMIVLAGLAASAVRQAKAVPPAGASAPS